MPEAPIDRLGATLQVALVATVLSSKGQRAKRPIWEVTVTEDEDRESKLEWLREAPSAREVRLFLEWGDEFEVSEDARQALERLMTELNEAEVQGYAMPGLSLSIFSGPLALTGKCTLHNCKDHNCTEHNCSTYGSQGLMF